MDVVILLVLISLGLVAASLFFFFHRLREGDFDHAERLALAPLDDDPLPSANGSAATNASRMIHRPGAKGERPGGERHRRQDWRPSQRSHHRWRSG